MWFLIGLVVLAIVFFSWIYRLNKTRGLKSAILICGTTLSIARITVFSLGAYLVSNSPDLWQVIGYVMVLCGFPELGFVSGLRNHFVAWILTGSVFVAIGSFIWASVLAAFSTVLIDIFKKKNA